MAKKSLQIVGPFITNYSFARVNRGIALALSKIQEDYDVFLYEDPNRIDKWPDENEAKLHPEAINLWLKERTETDIAIYNNYPKTGQTLHGLKDLPAKTKMMYLAWEETVFPKMWVDEINENLHGMMVASTFVRDLFRKAGIKIPIEVVLNALDDKVRASKTEDYPLKTKKKFKFLHVSSARMRKGVDVLLKAYFSEFSGHDDVCLVIKSFPGPDNLVNELLSDLKKENSPEVIHIYNPDLTDQELTNLVCTCDCGVYPSRAEGFGIPIAETMYHEKPVIATNYSAYLDFCNEENSFLIDYELKDAVDSEAVNLGAKWAEPNQKDLQRKMRFIYESFINETKSDLKIIEDKVAKAKVAADNLTWENSANKALPFIKEVEELANLKSQNIAVISTVNSESGISRYTKYLYSPIEKSFKNFYYLSNSDITDRFEQDEDNVIRNWESGETEFKKVLKFVKEKNINIVHIQYHSGFNFPPEALNNLIKNLKELNIKVFVTLHAVRSDSFDFIKEVENLKLADKVIIHNESDFDYAKNSLTNVALFPIPKLIYKKRSKSKLRKQLGLDKYSKIIASHGLVNTNKHIPNIIHAIAELKEDIPNILYLGLHAVSSNNVSSGSEYESCLKLIEELGLQNNVMFMNDFLSESVIEMLLQSSDLNILAYGDVGESASDAVSKCLASLNPTIVTDIKMFSEFNDEVLKIPDVEVSSIVEGIKKLLEDKELGIKISTAAKDYIENNSYERKVLEMLKMYTT